MVYAICTTAGCTGSGSAPPRGDGGEDDGGSAGAARLTVQLSAEEPEVGDEPALTEGLLGVAELRVRNDRGGDLEPRVESLGAVVLTEEPTLELGPVTPATYGRAILHLSAGDWGPAFDLTVQRGSESLHVVGRDEVTIDVRCELPVLLAPGSAGQVRLTLEPDTLFDALPEPPDPEESIEVDAESAPEALAALEAALAVAWTASCELSEEAEGATTEALDSSEPDH